MPHPSEQLPKPPKLEPKPSRLRELSPGCRPLLWLLAVSAFSESPLPSLWADASVRLHVPWCPPLPLTLLHPATCGMQSCMPHRQIPTPALWFLFSQGALTVGLREVGITSPRVPPLGVTSRINSLNFRSLLLSQAVAESSVPFQAAASTAYLSSGVGRWTPGLLLAVGHHALLVLPAASTQAFVTSSSAYLNLCTKCFQSRPARSHSLAKQSEHHLQRGLHYFLFLNQD